VKEFVADNLQIEIYTKFLDEAVLTDLDREKLKKKRGFTDKIIDKFKFVSGREENRKIINELRDKYEEQVLYKYGLLEEVNDNFRPCNMLLNERVIIPYLDESGDKCTLLRPHKLGLKGVNIQPYCQFLLKDNPEHIVLTEGEFKATALAQWGIPAMAVPGIQSFSGKHFKRLIEYLNNFKVKKITIIFDNEVKNDSQFKEKYKEKPENRWDTPYWACVMQTKLKKEGFDTKISRLPDEWRDKGKIDFDGALAQGKNKNDILPIINDRKNKYEFFDILPNEAEKIVRRKLAKYFSRSPVTRRFYGYEITKRKGDNTWEKQISNFVINIKSSFITPDGVQRYVEFVNEFGETSRTFILEPKDMAGLNEFKKYCFGKGNYIWEGTTQELLEVWKFELRRDTGDMIYMPEEIGEIEPNFWIFGNIAIKDNEVYQPDSDGIFWINGKGYKPQSLSVGPRGEDMEDAIPALYLEDDFDVEKIAEKLKYNLGSYQAYIGIGWVVATIFSRVIFEEIGNFPFLFLHGKRESGKTTLLRWLMNFFGIESDGVSIDESSQNYIMRTLSYFSSLGVWFDEYRNEKNITKKDGYLRSAYNRQLSGKGVKSAFGARAYKVKGTLAISGEELPRDSGLFTRCVPLQLSANKRNRDPYKWLNRMSEKFSGFTFHLLKNYTTYKDEIIETIKDLKLNLVQQDITDRTAENWAIMAGSFYAVVKKDKDFIEWVLESCEEVRETAEDEHMLNIFWNDVVIMYSNNDIGDRHIKTTYEGDKSYIGMWFPAVFNSWEAYYRRRTGNQPFDKASVLGYIKDEPYYVERKTIRLDGKPKMCYIIDPENAPAVIKELKTSIQSE
jgi:DNA primase